MRIHRMQNDHLGAPSCHMRRGGREEVRPDTQFPRVRVNDETRSHAVRVFASFYFSPAPASAPVFAPAALSNKMVPQPVPCRQ
ncbi:hypothetical protein ACRALDRAFT_1063760 [Sodiomyces alcalophilus JCM 7366]|uniref:uncharacterized protein n=1 Tax=Sodiomyces alcalophilus JCM 7366 TaxID=591952 RepID=UPI0039B4D3D5